MENDIPSPNNRALAEILVGTPMRRRVQEAAEERLAIYRAISHKRTGRTAREAQVSTLIGGRRKDRWVARVTVDKPTSMAVAVQDLRRTLVAGGRR